VAHRVTKEFSVALQRAIAGEPEVVEEPRAGAAPEPAAPPPAAAPPAARQPSPVAIAVVAAAALLAAWLLLRSRGKR